MIQSDTLSRRPDFYPDEDNDNENIILLPDDLFISLIDERLQQRIAKSKDLDGNVAEALQLLLETGPTIMTAGLHDWTIDKSNGRNILFYKGRTTFHKTSTYDEILSSPSMIMRQLDTLEKSEHTMRYDRTIGGPDYERL